MFVKYDLSKTLLDWKDATSQGKRLIRCWLGFKRSGENEVEWTEKAEIRRAGLLPVDEAANQPYYNLH